MSAGGVDVRRAIGIARGGITAPEGVCDRIMTRLEASLAGTAERHMHHSQGASHLNEKVPVEIKHYSGASSYLWDINNSG